VKYEPTSLPKLAEVLADMIVEETKEGFGADMLVAILDEMRPALRLNDESVALWGRIRERLCNDDIEAALNELVALQVHH
jgi:hypothetical protein